MYYDFFGFREPPFSIAPDPRYLYLSERHKEALAHLMYGVQGQGGFIVITGEVGTGKTTVSRCFIENAPEHVDIALILNPRLSARELLATVCDEFGILYPDNATIKPLVDRINQHLLAEHANGRHQVLMIDEAQNLSAEVLEQLRLLTNLETAEKKLLQIVLLGQPELQGILDRPELRQLNQRVTARYHLDALEKDELPAYLHYRLGVAGVKVDLFTPGAVRVLYRKSQGVPRLINLISDRALLGAYTESLHLVEARHIRAAAKEVGVVTGNKVSEGGISPVLRYLTITAAVAALALIVLVFLDRDAHTPAMNAAPVQLVPAESLPEAAPGKAFEGSSGLAISAAPAGDTITGSVQRETVAGGPGASGSLQDSDEARADLTPFTITEHGMTTADAYSQLFRLWGENWSQREGPFACDYAADVRLRCLHRQGSRRSMEQLDRPAVMELRDSQGDRHYVTLESLDGKRARIRQPSGSLDIAFEDLEQYWFGQFSILWRLPPYMTDEVEDGRHNTEGVWLSARMMQLVSKHTSDNREIERVSRLVREEQVRWYQQITGLEPDGVVGALTLIQMNNDLEPDVPRLRPDPGAGRG